MHTVAAPHIMTLSSAQIERLTSLSCQIVLHVLFDSKAGFAVLAIVAHLLLDSLQALSCSLAPCMLFDVFCCDSVSSSGSR